VIDFLDNMLAAKDGDRFGWVVPLAIFVFWIINAVAKGKQQKQYDEKLDDKLDVIDTRGKPSKYKEIKQEPETIYIAPPKDILRKKLRTQQARQAQVCASVHTPQERAAKPKPQPRKVRRPAPQAVKKYRRQQVEPEKELEILPEIPESMIENIREPQTIRDAIVLSEIIGQPRSLNQWQY
jgi:hypothetical protein